MQRGKLTGSGEAPRRIPSSEGRQVNLARSYVEGLERDRHRLRELEAQYDRQTWELIQISAYAKALYTALYQLYTYSTQGGSPPWDRVEDLLEADRKVYNEIWACECGHHRWDHDEDGRCLFLGCKRICGHNTKETT